MFRMTRYLMLLLAALLVLTACSTADDDEEVLLDTSVTEETSANYRTTTVERTDYIETVQTGVSLYYPVTSTLSWDEDEYAISEILVSEGDLVEEGDVLITLTYTGSEITLEEKKLELERLQTSYENGLSERETAISEACETRDELSSVSAAYAYTEADLYVQQLEVSYAQYVLSMESQIETLEEEIAALEESYETQTITAPYAGEIDSVTKLTAGGSVTAGETLIEMHDTETVVLVGENPSGAFLYGQPVTITSNDQDYEGVVAAAQNVLTLGLSTDMVAVTLNNPEDQENLSGSIVIVAETLVVSDVLCISRSALIYDGGDYYVEILDEDETVHLRPVTLGCASSNGNGTVVWVLEGIEEGDTLILQS